MVVYTLEQRWACDRLTEDVDFVKKIICSDEADFDLGGYVNKQNCRIWGTSHCLVQILVQRHNWTIFLRK